MQDWRSLFLIDDNERASLIERLFEESKPSPAFYLLLGLSTVIAAIGLLQGNAPVVVGAMLVAPILAPVLTLGSSIVTGKIDVVIRSIYVLVRMMIIVLAITAIVALFYGDAAMSPVLSRNHAAIGDFIVALAAGVAAAFAYAHPNLSIALPGIAISVSLLPPLVNSGLYFFIRDRQSAVGALGLFGANLLGIIFAAVVIFSLLNLYRVRVRAEKAVEREKNNA